MTYYDIIFWYTGSFFWMLIGLCIFLVVLFITFLLICRFYDAVYTYKGIRKLLSIPLEDTLNDSLYATSAKLHAICRKRRINITEDELNLILKDFSNSEWDYWEPETHAK